MPAGSYPARNGLSKELFIRGSQGDWVAFESITFTEPVTDRIEHNPVVNRGRSRAALPTRYLDGTGSITCHRVPPDPRHLDPAGILAGTIVGVSPTNETFTNRSSHQTTVATDVKVYDLRCLYKSTGGAVANTERIWQGVHFMPAETVSEADDGDTIEFSITVYGADSGEVAI